MSVSPDARYSLHSAANLHWAVWNDEYVVFDEASGQTHQLDAVRAYVLHLLSEGSQSFSKLAVALSQLSVFPAKPATNGVLSAVLGEFETSGLVEVIEQ